MNNLFDKIEDISLNRKEYSIENDNLYYRAIGSAMNDVVKKWCNKNGKKFITREELINLLRVQRSKANNFELQTFTDFVDSEFRDPNSRFENIKLKTLFQVLNFDKKELLMIHFPYTNEKTQMPLLLMPFPDSEVHLLKHYNEQIEEVHSLYIDFNDMITPITNVKFSNTMTLKSGQNIKIHLVSTPGNMYYEQILDSSVVTSPTLLEKNLKRKISESSMNNVEKKVRRKKIFTVDQLHASNRIIHLEKSSSDNIAAETSMSSIEDGTSPRSKPQTRSDENRIEAFSTESQTNANRAGLKDKPRVIKPEDINNMEIGYAGEESVKRQSYEMLNNEVNEGSIGIIATGDEINVDEIHVIHKLHTKVIESGEANSKGYNIINEDNSMSPYTNVHDNSNDKEPDNGMEAADNEDYNAAMLEEYDKVMNMLNQGNFGLTQAAPKQEKRSQILIHEDILLPIHDLFIPEGGNTKSIEQKNALTPEKSVTGSEDGIEDHNQNTNEMPGSAQKNKRFVAIECDYEL